MVWDLRIKIGVPDNLNVCCRSLLSKLGRVVWWHALGCTRFVQTECVVDTLECLQEFDGRDAYISAEMPPTHYCSDMFVCMFMHSTTMTLPIPIHAYP